MARSAATPRELAQLDLLVELGEAIGQLNHLLKSPTVEFITPNIQLDNLPRQVDTVTLEEEIRKGDRAIVMAIEALNLRLIESTKAAGTRMGSFSGGSSQTIIAGAKNSSVTRVAASTGAVSLLTPNQVRKTLFLVNDSSSIAYVKLGLGASSTSFTYKMSGGSEREFPAPVYLGDITAVWESATGAMQITELT